VIAELDGENAADVIAVVSDEAIFVALSDVVSPLAFLDVVFARHACFVCGNVFDGKYSNNDVIVYDV
jgi:hypothetical protein